MIASAEDTDNANLNRASMRRFRHFIANEELRGLYMHDRRYTWSNERDNPTLVRNDRILCTSGWEIAHPHCLLQCLPLTASDHCPLLIDCTPDALVDGAFTSRGFGPPWSDSTR